MKSTGELLGCGELCVCCYHYLSENIFRFKCDDANRATVKEIANLPDANDCHTHRRTFNLRCGRSDLRYLELLGQSCGLLLDCK